MKKYFGNWSSYNDMVNELHRGEYDYQTRSYKPVVIPEDFPTDEQVLFATYDYGDYCGDATIIYERDGKIYEQVGGHCSCYGINESMGDPHETSREALGMRKFSPSYDVTKEAQDYYHSLFPEFTPKD
jgi:hypothetical protein